MLKVSARDADGSIASVDYYEDSQLLGTVTNAPFSFAWTNVAVGTHTLTAVATDNLGDATTSNPVTFTILADTDSDGIPDIVDANPVEFDLQRLGNWKFDNTNNWVGEQGQLPVIATNLVGIPAWSSNQVQVQSGVNVPARLLYRTVETNGLANIAADQGTVRFWFSPNWVSAYYGPSGSARLFEFGTHSSGTNHGAWTLYVDSFGRNLVLASTTNELIRVTIDWSLVEWKHIAVTYSATNSAIYINGKLAGTGAGVPAGIDVGETLSIGSNGGQGNWVEPVWVPPFVDPARWYGGWIGGIWVDDPQNLGGDAYYEWIQGVLRLGRRIAGYDGMNQAALGRFDDLEIFNHPLDASQIATNLFPPTVDLAMPTNGQVFSAWANISTEITAASAVGAITEVGWLVNSNFYGRAIQPPYMGTIWYVPLATMPCRLWPKIPAVCARPRPW